MGISTNEDSFLLERLRKGDMACFEALYQKYSGRLYNFVLKMSKGDFYMAEEIVQRVFVKIWEIHPHINVDGSFNSFLFTISRNMFLNMLKTKLQEALYRDYSMVNDELADNQVEKEIEYKFLEEQINRLIDQLPPSRRQVFVLSRMKNMPNKEIAALLGISENTVESQLNKALRYMRQNLVPYYRVMIAFYVTNNFF